jgi:hypothetical protein
MLLIRGSIALYAFQYHFTNVVIIIINFTLCFLLSFFAASICLLVETLSQVCAFRVCVFLVQICSVVCVHLYIILKPVTHAQSEITHPLVHRKILRLEIAFVIRFVTVPVFKT